MTTMSSSDPALTCGQCGIRRSLRHATIELAMTEGWCRHAKIRVPQFQGGQAVAGTGAEQVVDVGWCCSGRCALLLAKRRLQELLGHGGHNLTQDETTAAVSRIAAHAEQNPLRPEVVPFHIRQARLMEHYARQEAERNAVTKRHADEQAAKVAAREARCAAQPPTPAVEPLVGPAVPLACFQCHTRSMLVPDARALASLDPELQTKAFGALAAEGWNVQPDGRVFCSRTCTRHAPPPQVGARVVDPAYVPGTVGHLRGESLRQLNAQARGEGPSLAERRYVELNGCTPAEMTARQRGAVAPPQLPPAPEPRQGRAQPRRRAE